MTANLVTLRDLRVTLNGVDILKGVNADLGRGSITALIGLNGSGKTTLLRTLVKEVPYTGQIVFHCGHDHRRPVPEHVGYVPQRLNIEAGLPVTVKDLFGLTLQRRPLFFGIRRRVRSRLGELLAQVNVADLENRLVRQLSGCELQRVLLALALEPNPELLLLDEPASGIDFKDAESFYQLIGDLNRNTGVTILLVSHELSVVSRLAHHVLCLAEGRIQCQGAPEEIVTHEVLTKTFGAGSKVYHHGHDHAPSNGQPESPGAAPAACPDCVTPAPSSGPPARTS